MANAVLDKAIEQDKNDYKLFYNKSLINFNLKNYNQAFDNIKQAIALKPDEADNYHLEGMINEVLNNKK